MSFEFDKYINTQAKAFINNNNNSNNKYAHYIENNSWENFFRKLTL